MSEELKRIAYLANVCRTENDTPEIQYLLNELDSSIADYICEQYGIDEYENMMEQNR